MSCYLGTTTEKYHQEIIRKRVLFFSLIAMMLIIAVYAVSKGVYSLSLIHVIKGMIGISQGNPHLVVWNIRMPRIIAAIITGWGLALSGLTIQTLLKNPLGSSSTLGISQGSAFGAALGIIIFDSAKAGRLYSVTLFAFLGAMAATCVILLLAKLKKLSSEAIILAGVALSSLFHSGTILIQYFGTETQVASALFWTFGDLARSGWREIGMIASTVFIASIWVMWHRWNLNAMVSGEETAKGLGVSVDSLRFQGMMIAALVSASITAFQGVIVFVGLLAPHIARRVAGSDHRLLIPFSCVIGALLLLSADTLGRVMIGSGSLPVGILTSFMGAPLFLYLLIKRSERQCCYQ